MHQKNAYWSNNRPVIVNLLYKLYQKACVGGGIKIDTIKKRPKKAPLVYLCLVLKLINRI